MIFSSKTYNMEITHISSKRIMYFLALTRPISLIFCISPAKMMNVVKS